MRNATLILTLILVECYESCNRPPITTVAP